MEEEEASVPDFIFEEREEIMVFVSGADQNPQVLRKAHFLKPSFTPSSKAKSLISPLSVSLSSATLLPTKFEPKKWPLKVNFNGWRYPIPLWLSWFRKLHDKYQHLWKDASIYESILSSTLQISRRDELIIGFAEKWCSNTNTFIFHWGETTITLEDILILGGFSLVGCPVTCGLSCCVLHSPDFIEIENKLKQERSKLRITSNSQTKWIQNCMGTEIEHEAFLSLWLSKFVFNADHFDVIKPHLFRVAILLARGKRFAFAPAVLSSIYSDLSLLKESILASSTVCQNNRTVVILNSPLGLVQFWVWERFSAFQPRPKWIKLGDPRAARWGTVEKSKLKNVRLALDSVAADGFIWRPYAVEMSGWKVPDFYKSKEELRLFCICLRASELVAFDCIQQYLPHRVALQFGMDQDVPADVIRHNESPEIAWKHYMRPICDLPSRTTRESGLTLRYLKWWENQDLSEDGQHVLQEAIRETNDIPVVCATDFNQKVVSAEFYANCGSTTQQVLLDTTAPANGNNRKFSDNCTACFSSNQVLEGDNSLSLVSIEGEVWDAVPLAKKVSSLANTMKIVPLEAIENTRDGELEPARKKTRDDVAVNVADFNKNVGFAEWDSIAGISDIALMEVDIPPSFVQKNMEVEMSRYAGELMMDKQVEFSDVVAISDDSFRQTKCHSSSARPDNESWDDKIGKKNDNNASVGPEDRAFADVGSTHLEDDPLDVLDFHKSLEQADIKSKEIPVYEILDFDDDEKDEDRRGTELRGRLARLQEMFARHAAAKSGKRCDQNSEKEIIIIDDD